MHNNSQRVFDKGLLPIALAALFKTKLKAYSAITGGGTGFPDLLSQIPGTSSILVGSDTPYAFKAFDRFIGTKWWNRSYCSIDAAAVLAHESFYLAQEIQFADDDLSSEIVGIGLSAAVATDKTSRGGTRVYVAIRTRTATYGVKIRLRQVAGQEQRAEDLVICELSALNLLLFVAKLPQIPFAADLGIESENLVPGDSGLILRPDILSEIILPETLEFPLLISPEGLVSAVTAHDFSNTIIFPGTFDLLHFGHHNLATIASKMFGRRVIFEITSRNAAKQERSVESLALRAGQGRGRWDFIVRSDAGLFLQKARSYPGAHFIVGADIASLILDPRYYENDGGLTNVLRQFQSLGTVFYVLDREHLGEMIAYEDLPIPPRHNNLFVSLPGHQWQVSSTLLRNHQAPLSVD